MANRKLAWCALWLIALTSPIIACGSGPQEESSQAFSAVAAAPGAPGGLQLCANHDVHVVDVQGDLRDIWAGRETAETGKQTSRTPAISIRFDHVVDGALLDKALTLSGVTGSTGRVATDCRSVQAMSSIDTVKLGTSYPIGTWTAGTVNSTSQRYLYDFQIFATGSVAGTPHVAGPIAAGDSISLSGFSVNTDGTQPYALIAGGNISLSSGSVLGAVTYGGAASIPQSVYVGGTATHETPIDFASLAPRIASMSDGLAAQPPNADTSVSGHAVTFAGVRPELNVFSVDSATLGAATSIKIQAPATAAVLINVTGATLSMQSLGMSLSSGITADRIVWNVPNATAVALASLSFRGSIIAPRAAVTFTSGDMAGQLVAASVGGSGVYNTVKFVGWEQFGAVGSSATITATAPLQRGCVYTLKISGIVAKDYSCVQGTFSLPFTVDTQDRLAVSRDAEHIVWSPDRARVTAFVPRAGVNTPTAEVLARYASALGVGASDGFTRLSSVTSPLLAGNTVYYRQSHAGVPVIGGGFTIDEDAAGIARGVRGRVVGGLPGDVTAATTQAQAQATALTAIGAHAPFPWQSQPNKFKAPTSTLAFVTTVTPAKLAWHVDLSASGVDAVYVDVDAKANLALASERGEKLATCAFTPTAATEISHGPIDVNTLFHGTQTIDTDVFQQNGIEEKALRSESPMPILGQTGVANGPVGDPNRLAKLVDICTASGTWTDDDTRDAATGMWYMQKLGAFFADRGLKYGDKPWLGIDGKNEATLTLVTSSDPSWSSQPGKPSAYYNVVTSEIVDPYIVIDPNFLKTSSNDTAPDFVQSDVLGHEFGHGVQLAAIRRAGVSVPYQLESGALSEAWADIIGAAFARSLAPASPWWCSASDCVRSMKDPKSSTDSDAPLPDTYKGVGYAAASPPCKPGTTNGGNDLCGVHQNLTVATHWFYLLATADNGDGVNDNQCTYAVPAIGADASEQFERAFAIAFYGLTQELGDNPDFLAAREATVSAARRLYGDDVSRATEEAWLAVGVGSGPEITAVTPQNDARSVPVWPTEFSWKTTDQGAWQVQIATDDKFTSNVQVVDAKEITGGTTRTLGAKVILDPAPARYYWRVRRTSGAAWPAGNCLSVFWFQPAAPEIHLLEPTKKTGDHFDADDFGTTTWEIVPGVNTYYVTVSATKPASCPALDSGGVLVGGAPIGFTTESYSHFFGNGPPDFNTTYYETIAAVSPDGNSLGPCLIVPYRVRNFPPPAQLYPLPKEYVHYNAPDFAFYRFKAVDGAVSYQITISRPSNDFAWIYNQTKPVGELKTGTLMDGTAYVDFAVPVKFFAGTLERVLWDVRAIAADGYVSPPVGGFAFDELYNIGVGVPALVSPTNNATNVTKSSLSISWKCENCKHYEITLKHASDGAQVFHTEVDHVGDFTTLQTVQVGNTLNDADSYTIAIVASNPGEPLTGTTSGTFKTGPKPTLSAPKLVFDAVCEPATPGLGTILNSASATEFIITDVPAADEFEFEFIDFDTGDVNARALGGGCKSLPAAHATCPALTAGQAVACVISQENFTFRWSAAQQAAAEQRSQTVWGGFSYSYFHVRAINSSQNVKSDYSRRGVMVSCLFPDLCGFDQDASHSNVYPHGSPINDPTIANVCDDILLAQILQNVAPANSCIQWTP